MTDTPTNDLANLPSALSPSRAKDFVNCPQAFYYKSIKRLPTKNTEVNTRGTIAHDALENLFKLPAGQRTIEAALSYVGPAWDSIKEKSTYQHLASTLTPEQELKMLRYAEEMVKNYFLLENPNEIHPTGVEENVKSQIGDDLQMRGIIDRLSKPFIPALGKEAYVIDDYKGLDLDTPIPTPHGWTTMGDLQVGDEVLGSNGTPVKVTAVSKIHNRICYEITIDDNETLTCDNVHIWSVVDEDGNEHIVPTYELEDLRRETNLYIIEHDPLELPPINFTEPTSEVARKLIEGEIAELPIERLRGSSEQRVALLRNINELTGGTYQDGKYHIPRLSNAFERELNKLLVTLGTESHWGNSEDGSIELIIAFTSSLEPRRRLITRLEQVDSVPTKCISVNAPDEMYLAGETMIPTHNTGKIPQISWLENNFFAMRVYALLMTLETGEMPFMLRLIYLKGKTQEQAIKRLMVTPEMLEETRQEVLQIWADIKTAAETNTWPAKPGPLCNFCDFKETLCPAFNKAETES